MSTKSEILFYLESNRGKYISGEQLARELGLSRTAVWKAMNALIGDGHKIAATPNRGYMLDAASDVLSEQGILARLPEGLRGNKLKVLKTVDSTNTRAHALAAQGAPHGAIIAAGGQTAGRGRSGKSFFSPPDSGLYMSLILRGPGALRQPQMITVAAAIGVCRAIEAQTGLEPEIKWVNDILLDGKKVCGILTEAVTDFESGGIDCIIVGVGINCKAPEGGFPPEIRDIAGALNFPGLSRNQLCADIAAGIMERQRTGGDGLIDEYRSRCKMAGKCVEFMLNGKLTQAAARGIDDDCGLLVALDDGTETVLRGGEVSVRGSKL